jgi:uncharacterized membrane protein YdbT with pleckstrin-like domain
MEEQIIWKGSSSEVVNLGSYLLSVVVAGVLVGLALAGTPVFLAGLVVPLGAAVWKRFANHCRVYEVTTERVKLTSGIVTRRAEELELYRVKDTTLVEPLLYRLFSAGNIILTTTDQTTPRVTIEAIKNPSPLRDKIRKSIETCRDRKRVRVAELE